MPSAGISGLAWPPAAEGSLFFFFFDKGQMRVEGQIAGRTITSPHLPSVYNTLSIVHLICLSLVTRVSTVVTALWCCRHYYLIHF